MTGRILLIGSNSTGKVSEIKALMDDQRMTFLRPSDVDVRERPTEDGKSALENAVYKALFYFEKSGLPVIADDSEFFVDALRGDPGVKVRRWKGCLPEDISDCEWLEYFMNKMKGVPQNKRTASFHTVFAMTNYSGEVHMADCWSHFIIAAEPELPIVPGMPINSVRFIPEKNRMYNQLTEIEQLEVHRGKAKAAILGALETMHKGM